MLERLQKLIATAGLASRRHAEEMIEAGQVTVNGQVVSTLGTKADPDKDHIKVNGRLINPLLAGREKVYILLNKPKGYLSSVSDPEKRPLVTELVPEKFGRLYPVGRLDFNTEGLLLLSNDGEFTNFVTSARNNVAKVYEVKVKGVPPDIAVERLRRGIILEDGVRTKPAEVVKADERENNAWFTVTLHEGRNQQIRKMFDAIGHSVTKLRRIQIGFLKDERLPVGSWRMLAPAEVKRLMKAPLGKVEKKAAGTAQKRTAGKGAKKGAGKSRKAVQGHGFRHN
jgi:23S rRNA pseudouridine2605 synthase